MLRIDSLESAIVIAATKRSRLVVLPTSETVGLGSYESNQINLNKALSSRLMNVSRSERAAAAPKTVSGLLNEVDGDTVLIIGLEVLFDRSLAIEPLRLLAACAKNKTLLVCWPGEITNEGLSYAIPSHPEYRSYRASDLSEVILLEADGVKL